MDSARKVVVIGGGIIGSSTAFYLKRRGAYVTILEASSIAAGASGKAGGFLAEDWHGPATQSLSTLSFQLHKDLAKEFGGIDYREVTAVSVSLDTTSERVKRVPGAEWINDKAISKSSKLGGEDTCAQVHPRLLTERLAEEVGNVIIAQAESVEFGSDGKPVAVLARKRDGEEVKLECTDVVVAAGPWSGTLARKLFKDVPSVPLKKLQIQGSRAHSVGGAHFILRYSNLPPIF